MTSSSKPAPRRNVPSPSGTASAAGAKAATYARFIPREELNSFAAWAPGDVSGNPQPERRAQPQARPADNAEQHAELVRQARQSGYQDGYRDGLVALEGFKQSFAMQATRQVGVLLESIGGQLDALQQEMARAVAATAVSLAEQIVRSALTLDPAVVVRVADEALEALLLNARHITLRVHPDDHALVADGAADIIAARGARLVADATVTRGGCLIDSDIGSIDASVESRWRHATAKLGFDATPNFAERRRPAEPVQDDRDGADNGSAGTSALPAHGDRFDDAGERFA